MDGSRSFHSKQAHLIPCRKQLKAPKASHFFIQHIFRLHGMPKSIVSDINSKFTSNFLQELFDNLSTDLSFSSSFHPQNDGQCEIMNNTFLDLLKFYVHDHQMLWENLLITI